MGETSMCIVKHILNKDIVMKRILYLNILLLVFSSSFARPLDNSKPWEYSRTISGIRIYQRAGATDGIFEFLAVTSIEKSADPILKTVLDIPANRYWMANCIQSEYLAGLNTGEVIAYYVTAPPWPVSKRDSIIRIRKSSEQGRITFTMSSLGRGEAEKYKTLNPEYVRIYEMEGIVTLEETNPGSTEVKFSVAGESGGNVPGFIVRMGGWTIPYKTLSGLKKYIN
jgi:hypothetical protein